MLEVNYPPVTAGFHTCSFNPSFFLSVETLRQQAPSSKHSSPLQSLPGPNSNERRLKGANQSPAPSESKLLKSRQVDGHNSHLCCESTHGNRSIMKLDIFLLTLWVLSAVCLKWQLTGERYCTGIEHWLTWLKRGIVAVCTLKTKICH